MREFLAMLGKTNSNMGGKAVAAAYVFENSTPRQRVSSECADV